MKDDNGRWVSRQMGDERESVSSSVFRTRAGESELFGKLKVGRASLGEEREGLEGCAIIINAAGVCRAQASEGHTSSTSTALGRRSSQRRAGAHGTPAGAGWQFCEDTPVHRQAASNRRLFWACARLTPQLSIRVTGFACTAIRLTNSCLASSEGASRRQSQA